MPENTALYIETSTRLGPGGAGGLAVWIRPSPGRRTLPDAVVNERIAAACAARLDEVHRWQMNFDLYFKSGAEARWPRRYGAPLEGVAALLRRTSARGVAESIRSDSDHGDTTWPICGVLVRVFQDRRQVR